MTGSDECVPVPVADGVEALCRAGRLHGAHSVLQAWAPGMPVYRCRGNLGLAAEPASKAGPSAPARARFHLLVIGGRLDQTRIYRDTEAAILCEAGDHVGPNCTQVSITGHGDTSDTFAVRHLSWQSGDGDGHHDTGWRAWVDGRFIGGVEHWPMSDADLAVARGLVPA